MQLLFLQAQMRFHTLRGRGPQAQPSWLLPAFPKVPTRTILVPGARSVSCLGHLTEAGQQHIWFPLALLPLPPVHFPLSHCVSLVTGCWRCLDKSSWRDSQYVLSLCLVCRFPWTLWGLLIVSQFICLSVSLSINCPSLLASKTVCQSIRQPDSPSVCQPALAS